MKSKTEISATQPENDEPRVYFSKKSTKVDVGLWFRGDRRDPVGVFDEGFSSRGTNTNFLEHVHGNNFDPIKDSGYISTSTSQEAALRYPKGHMGRSYLYLINPQKKAVDVNKALVLEIDSGLLARDTAEFYFADKEMAVPYKIEPKHIKGAWIAESTALTKELHEISDLYEREVKSGSFIGNPDYIEPYAKTIKTLKIAGKGIMAIGIYLDADNLFEMYQHAEASGNYHPFFTEASRIAGGWSGAVALGEAWGAKGASYAIRFTKHPGVILTCGVVGALVGAVVGYNGGGLIATEIYDRTLNSNESSSEFIRAMMPDYSNQTTSHQDTSYETEPDVLNPEITKSLGHQRSPFASCIKDKLKHRFVTPYYVSQSELEKETGLLLYAITDKEKLIVAKQESLSLDDKGNIKQASHMDLTRGRKIIAAGMITIEHGDIISIDSHAPDYEPINIASIALQKKIERIFSNHDFPEVKDKFVREHLSSSRKIETLPEKLVVVNQKMPASTEPMFAVEHIPLYEIASRESIHKPSLMCVQQLAPVDFESKKAVFAKTVQQMSARKSTPNHGDKIASNQFRRALNVSQSSMFRVSTPHHVSSLTEDLQITTPKAEKMKKITPHQQQPAQQNLTYVKINDSCGLIWDDEGKPINVFER